MKKEISFEHYNKFKETINYSSPQKIPTRYFHDIDMLVRFIKDEITNNIIIFDRDNRIAYLKKILKDLKMYESFISVTIEEINKWLKKYNTSLPDTRYSGDKENELHFFLKSHPPTYDEQQKEGYNPDKEEIQQAFCNYYSVKFIRELIDFTEDQFEITEPTTPKLKTNLSVPQLALLFKELNKLKPNIFDIKTNTELYQFISDSFATKQSSGDISTKSIKNKFEDPDQKTIDFWADKFRKMLSNVRD